MKIVEEIKQFVLTEKKYAEHGIKINETAYQDKIILEAYRDQCDAILDFIEEAADAKQ